MSVEGRGLSRSNRTAARRCAAAAAAALVGLSACTDTSPKPEPPRRVMLIGIDGATWRVIEAMFAAGQLPHLKKLYDEGLHGVLESRPPILSPVVWTVIFTGFDSDKNGVSDWKTSASNNRRVSALWEIARRQQIATDVFNVPGSWPAEPVHGVMLAGFPMSGSTVGGNTGEVIVGDRLDEGRPLNVYRDNFDAIVSQTRNLAIGAWTPWLPAHLTARPKFQGVLRAMRLAPDKIYVSPFYRTDDGLVVSAPPEARGHIADAIGEPYIAEGPGWSQWAEPDTPDYLYPHLAQIFDIQTRAALQYAGGEWGLLIYVMTFVDRVSHPYWAYAHPDDYPDLDRSKAKRYEHAVEDAYRASDEALGRMLATAHGEFYVVVVSDHGFGSSSDPSKQIGTHDPDGIYLIAGPHIGARPGGRAHIEDVTPTVLYLMGLPSGQDMSGKPIAEVVADLGRPANSIRSYERGDRAASDAPIDASTWEQLRGLGYVDGPAPESAVTGAVH